MKKSFLIFIMTCIIALGCTSCSAENSSNISVTVNGSAVTFDQPPIMANDRTLVPLRAIFEALGATVDWNGDTQTVTSTRGNTTVSLAIGSNIMTKNSISYELDVPAQIVGERTLVPVRAIAEAFGSAVDWNGETQTVIINDNGEQTEQPTTAELNHTYTTQYGTVNAVTYPQFAFDYSDNWTITTNDITKAPHERYETCEDLILTNSNGTTIHYIDFGSIGGRGKTIVQYDVSKVADCQFTAGYDFGQEIDYTETLGKFMVGAIKPVGEYDYKTGDLIPLDGKVSYAVMPESYIGIHEAVGLTGFYEEFSTDYWSFLIYAETSNDDFTDDERQEIIRILSTFRRNSIC